MEADPFQIGDVLKDAKRFVVPIYQRTYAWRVRPQLETFFDQIETKAEERLKGQDIFVHYMGAVLVIPRGKYSFGKLNVVDVVDGQQRLTTFQLFLAALRDVARENKFDQICDLLGSFLINADGPQLKEKHERYKLFPTSYDRELFCDLIDLSSSELRFKYPGEFYKNGKVLESARLPLRAWGYFRAEATEFIERDGDPVRSERLTALSAALLEHFQIIVITLDEKDDAQVIFETLNAGGEPLAAMDLVRNDVFHRVAKTEDIDLFMERKWSVFEKSFWKEKGRRGRIIKPRIDFFLSDALAAETGEEILLTELYATYRKFVRTRGFHSVNEELDALLRYVPVYHALVEPGLTRGSLQDLARNLLVYDVTTAFPLLLVVETSQASEEAKAHVYRLVESYIVRRMLCGLTAKNYNNLFIRIAAQLRSKGVSIENAVSAFSELEGDTVRFPTDADLSHAISTRRQYGNIQQHRLRHILGLLEVAARDKYDEATILPEGLTIEHVLPDSWTEHWPLPDGSIAAKDLRTGMDADQIKTIDERESLKHTLGNLTLLNTARNPGLGNLGFETKRAAFVGSLLKLNKEIAAHSVWNEDKITERAVRLAELALKLWPGLGIR